jgi:hypothetical protein
MSLRFPRYGTGGHEMASADTAIASPEAPGGGWLPPDPLTAPDRACCCTAKPMVKVIMPATAARPRPVDLWLCGHHWRVSREALGAAGASVHPLGLPDAGTPGAGARAGQGTVAA